MNRDFVIHELVAVDAQLRRIRRQGAQETIAPERRMNRDLTILNLVALRAQLHRIRRLALKVGSAEELAVRLPPLITEVTKNVDELCSRAGEGEAE
jgi:hypothetical protein